MAEEAIPVPADNPDTGQPQEEPAKEAAAAPISYSGTKHKVKIDDSEQEVTYEDLIREYQKGRAGDKRLREAAQLKKQVDEVVGNLKSGKHQNLVKLLGKDVARKMAEELLLEEIEYDELPQHEKTIRQLQREKEELEKAKQEQETQRQTLERQRLEKEQGQLLEQEIVTAIKESGAKVSPRLIARMAEVMEAYIVKTKQKLPAKEALKLVRDDIPMDFAAYVEDMSGEQIKELKSRLPKKFLDALRKDDVDSVLSQSSLSKGREKSDNLPEKKSKDALRRMSTDDWFERMEKKFAGG